MSLVDCIIKGSDQGIISAEKQMDMINDFELNKEKYLKLGMSEGAAERQAGIDTFDKVKYDKARKIQIATINAKKQAAFNYQIENSGMNPGEVMERFFGQMEVREGLKFINSVKVGNKNLNKFDKEKIKNTFEIFLYEVLALKNIDEKSSIDNKISSDLIKLLIKIRNQSRANKNFELSDQIRDDLMNLGVQLNDDKNESSYKMI